MNKVEILAPVGGEASLLAAVRSGADAVYFGATQFNARQNADNFDDEALAKAINYCRVNDVRCYLTLNTLIKDDEIASALELVNKAWCYGIDAIIIQDLGLARLLHTKFPSLPLHGSTQLSIHSVGALPLLRDLGFKRVVVAREMKKEELELFCQKAREMDIEVETFVHGALCMCLSGQCYFSAFLGGRSANRGLCAGTCRLPFNTKGGTGYDLSLKDLSLIPYFNQLAKMGVTSFKIEGRMKRPEYVAAATTAARQMVDDGKVNDYVAGLLEKVFSRDGFTDGYYKGSLGRNMFGVRTELDKQLSADATSKLHELYRHERQKLPLKMQFTLKANEPAKLVANLWDRDVTIVGEEPEGANFRPTDGEQVSAALSKLGGTGYKAEEILCDIEDGLVYPIAKIKSMRRQMCEEMDELLKLSRQAVDVSLPAIAPTPRKIGGYFVRFMTIEQFFAAAEQLPKTVGYSLPANILVQAVEKGDIDPETFKNIYAEMPRGAFDDQKTRLLFAKLKKLGVNKAVCSNLSDLALADQNGFEVFGGFGLNIFNSYSVEQLRDLGVANFMVSTELAGAELKKMASTEYEKLFVMCYGRQPLMLTRNCPVKNGIGCKAKDKGCSITDRKGEVFPLVCNNDCSEILNCKITDISDLTGEVWADYGYIYLTLESPSRAAEVIADFINGKGHSGNEFTRGLIRSGVK